MKMKKWILSTIFAFALAFAMTEPSSVAEASGGVTSGISYIDENGNQQTYTDSYNTVSDSSTAVTWGEAGKTTWYVVSSNVTCSEGITVYGTVNLVVMKDCTLTVQNELNEDPNSTLIIYGETATSGTIVAKGKSDYKAGIGKGGSLVINSGTVTAVGGQLGAGIGGDGAVTINGGIVTATGDYGAGIGGNNGGTCGTVTINGGIVTATGRNGIGCGNGGYNGNITINGGTVTATSSSTGYGIGSGTVFLTISGGYVKAVTGSSDESAICGEEIRVTGGYFADSSATVGISGTGKVYGCNVASGYSVNINEEADTKDDYPYVVMQTLAVTWVDGNGNKLQTDEVAYGAVPTAYSGDTPTKTASGSEFYTFTGWDKEISAVTANTTYTAQFAVSTITATSDSGSYTSATWATDDVTITLADTSQSVTGYQYSTDGGLTWINLDTTNGSATLTVSDATAGTDYLFRGVTASGTGAPSDSFTVKIDRTDPVIGGIEDGLIYCEDVSFTVTEDNLDVVTVNGAAVTEYTLQADGLTYEVIAYDQAGNSTVCTVTVNSGHTEGEAVSENEAAATCTESGSYDSVVYCTVCGEELNRETVTVSATGHSYTSTVVAPAYTEQGYTLHTCVICGYSYKTDYTDILVLDGTDGSVSTKTTVQELTVVPEGLKNLYSSVDALISDLIKRVIAVGTGYTADNTLAYDVVLQYSTDGGATWITATVDNFPTTGITVTLPYPDGTDASFEFTVLHMFTETSSRLGITAGGTETPTVTKTADGLAITLTGLSPVALSWKEGTVTSNTTTEDEPTVSETIETETSDTSSQTDETASTETSVTSASSTTAASTGDNSHTALWLVLLLISGLGVVTAIAFHRRKKTR